MTEGFTNWSIMTMHSWDENPVGTWILTEDNMGPSSNSGRNVKEDTYGEVCRAGFFVDTVLKVDTNGRLKFYLSSSFKFSIEHTDCQDVSFESFSVPFTHTQA